MTHPTFQDRSLASVTATLKIDVQRTIRFFSLIDTVHLDAEFTQARQARETQLSGAGAS